MVLGMLFVLLIYVWGSNLNWLADYDAIRPSNQIKSFENKKTITVQDLKYIPPKVNPFAIKVAENTPVKASVTRKSKRPQATMIPPRPSMGHRFIGFINQPPHSQALMAAGDDATTILELGDSLSFWKLITIKPSYVVLQYEKEHDTLMLVQ